MLKKYNKIISYLLLFLISIQTVLAGIDFHMTYEKDTPVDISHHYIDKHSEQSSCEIDPGKNISNLSVGEHNDESHHECSGHITLFSFNLSNCFKSNYLPQEITIHKVANLIIINHSPLFRPPIS